MKLPQRKGKLKTPNTPKDEKKDPSRLFIINVYICLPILLAQLLRVFLNSGTTLVFELVIDFPLILITVLTSLVLNGIIIVNEIRARHAHRRSYGRAIALSYIVLFISVIIIWFILWSIGWLLLANIILVIAAIIILGFVTSVLLPL